MNKFGHIVFYTEDMKRIKTGDVLENRGCVLTAKRTKDDWYLTDGKSEFSFSEFQWRFSEETTLKAILTGFRKVDKDGNIRMCYMW